MAKNFLLTGHPGVGKTTLVKKLVERLGHFALTGFYSEEIREGGRRVGFRAVALNGSSVVFAHRNFHTDPQQRVGRYGVRPGLFESLALLHLDPDRKSADLVVVDEIARMELLSQAFKEHLLQVLDSPCPLLATIALKGTGFVKQVKERPDVKVFTLTLGNRDVLEAQVERNLMKVLNQSSGLTG